MRITCPLAYFRVQGVIAFSTLRCTSLQTYLRESLRRIAPGSSPASSRIWNPLQMPDHVPAAMRELRHLVHDRREAGDGPGAQVVAVGEAARQHDHVGAAQIAILVPDVARRAAEDVLGDVVDVVVAVASRGRRRPRTSSAGCPPRWYSSITVLASSFSHISATRFFASVSSFTSRSSSMILPSRTSFTSPNPSEPRARPTACPCGSSTDFFSVHDPFTRLPYIPRGAGPRTP